VRVFFPKDVTQILYSLWHAPLALNTGSTRQGRGKKTLTVLLLLSVFKALKYYSWWFFFRNWSIRGPIIVCQPCCSKDSDEWPVRLRLDMTGLDG
jgi:hypothetical protein